LAKHEIKISVLLPTNSKIFLKEALDSIAAQTFDLEQIELVLVLDRITIESNDEIIPIYLRKNLKLVKSDSPGVVAALNIGLINCSAEFVARMDQDDLMLPDRLSAQFAFMVQNKNLLALGGQFNLMDVTGKRFGISNNPTKASKIKNTLLKENIIASPTVMFRNKSVKEVGGYREKLPEDWDLWIRLSEIGDVLNLKEIVLDYRIHKTQLSRNPMYHLENARNAIRLSKYLREYGEIDAPSEGEETESWISKWKERSPGAVEFIALGEPRRGLKTILKIKFIARAVIHPKRMLTRVVRYSKKSKD
jgi:glycosyltransferase involved in cell wall biosynthesis